MPFVLQSDRVSGTWSDDGETFTISAPIYYQVRKGRDAIAVPVGFRTDFASSWVGRFQLLSRKAAFSAAAVLHDWLYYEGLETRESADRIFRDALRSQGASGYDVFKAYWGVRLFGGSAWKSHRQRDWEKTWRKP
jgi:hypothetical protein